MDDTTRTAVQLALGRILRLAARPSQPGDDAEYDRCRGIILDALEGTAFDRPDGQPNWVRDRLRGAAGD